MSTPENHHVFTATELALKERYDAALEKIAEVAAQRDALKEANASASRELAEAKAYADTLAEGLPVGMLPKDIENLRSANTGLAKERDALKADKQVIYGQLLESRKQLASADREIERLNLMVGMMDESKELADSQREAERLRKALDEIEAVAETNPARNEEDQITLNAIIDLAQVATSSTPAPDRDFTAKSPSRQGEDGE